MGQAWSNASERAAAVLAEADAVLGNSLGAPLSEICANGPLERLNRTDVAQPAIYACSVASYRGLEDLGFEIDLVAAAGLSLGEYTALHLAGAFDFADGLRLVARRGQLMQEAAAASSGGMVALVGAESQDAETICERGAEGEVLVAANFNAPGQIVLSGHRSACDRALQIASELGLRATPLAVAGAFHSPLMQPAADSMAAALADAPLAPPRCPVWSNVTAEPHDSTDLELLRRRLVEQLTSPVRWSETCQGLVARGYTEFHELAPGSVLRGLMRRIERSAKVHNHDQPSQTESTEFSSIAVDGGELSRAA